MKLFYVSGKIRDERGQYYVERHIRDAELCALNLWRLGVAAICVHSTARAFSGALPDRIWIRGDLEMVRRSDAVVTVPNWEQSQGAMLEVAEARKNGTPVFHWPEQLDEIQEFIES